eukprot:gene7505-5290_t
MRSSRFMRGQSPLGDQFHFDDVFLTDLEADVPLSYSEASSHEGVESSHSARRLTNGNPHRLVPYCIPAPSVSLRRHYFPLYDNDNGMPRRHFLSEWEKKAILSRLQDEEPVNEERFQRRLMNVQMRNANPYISAVRLRRARQAEREMHQLHTEHLRLEKHRNDVHFRFKHLPTLRTMDRMVRRSEIWYIVIVSHVFLTALIHERKIQEALEKLSFVLGPMAKRFVTLRRKRRERAALTQEMLHLIPFPTPQVIMSMKDKFFWGWPPVLLEQLGQRSTPTYMRAGEFLMHEGDIGRAMFMITLGSVEIIIKNKNKDKRRSLDNALHFPIFAPCYVGEFALVCKEPRMASIRCNTDVGFWTVLQQDYEELSQYLNPEVKEKLRTNTDDRRRTNLKKLFPLKVELLRKFTYFERFTHEGLTKFVENVDPVVLHDGEFLNVAGTLDSSVYFIQDGVVMLIDENGDETPVQTGSCIGMFECACGVNERKTASIVSVNYCDIWRMPRRLLLDVGLSEPDALLHCRKAAKHARAQEIVKEERTPNYVLLDPYLSFCMLPSQLKRMYQLCTPYIFLTGEKIVFMGQKLTALILIVKGAVDLTVANNTEQESFRVRATSKEARPPEMLEGLRGYTYVIGAYEFAASVPKYTCTATSYGLTEAFIIDIKEVEKNLPPELVTIMRDHQLGRDIVARAYSDRDYNSLYDNKPFSFAQTYRSLREKEQRKQQKKEGFIR